MSEQVEKGQCPLCQEYFPMKELRIHFKNESEELKRYTVGMIQSQHPEWVENDGSCPKCWDFYSRL